MKVLNSEYYKVTKFKFNLTLIFVIDRFITFSY
jgi:hypothetical protein